MQKVLNIAVMGCEIQGSNLTQNVTTLSECHVKQAWHAEGTKSRALVGELNGE